MGAIRIFRKVKGKKVKKLATIDLNPKGLLKSLFKHNKKTKKTLAKIK